MSTETSDAAPPAKNPDESAFEPPGGFLVWMIVVLELITFGAGLGVYQFQKGQHAAEFTAGHEGLNQPLALVNTLLLLTGGWCMAVAISAIRDGQVGGGIRWIGGAIGTGVGFLILKGVEYSGKFSHGATFGEDHFYTLYFLLTGFHFLHVFAAVVILLYLLVALRQGKYTVEKFFDVESGGIFWHMCDLIWLLLYPVIYLMH